MLSGALTGTRALRAPNAPGLMVLMQAEDEVRRLIVEHTAAWLDLRLWDLQNVVQVGCSPFPRASHDFREVGRSGAPHAVQCPYPTARGISGEEGFFTHAPALSGMISGGYGGAQTPHSGVEWGKGDHNHPLPLPRECRESNGRVQPPLRWIVKRGGGDHNHPLPSPRERHESNGKVLPPPMGATHGGRGITTTPSPRRDGMHHARPGADCGRLGRLAPPSQPTGQPPRPTHGRPRQHTRPSDWPAHKPEGAPNDKGRHPHPHQARRWYGRASRET